MDTFRWVPHVEVESAYGTREMDLYTRQLMERNVFLQGKIDEFMANSIANQLMYLQSEGSEPINIFINSGGGEVQNGLVIYDLIQGIESPVNMYCMGLAGSMAAVLLASGQKGRRYILPHSKTMIHEPLISGGVGGSATSIRTISDSILETKEVINEILAKHTGRSIEEINEATKYDNYMNAKESVEFGICDEVKDTIKLR